MERSNAAASSKFNSRFPIFPIPISRFLPQRRGARGRDSGINPLPGELPEWPMGTDCKSVGECLRRFESSTPHHQTRR